MTTADAAPTPAATPDPTPSAAKPADDMSLPARLARMQRAQRAAGAPSCEQRIAHLERLAKALLRKKTVIADAISRDFGNRSKHETFLAEIFVSLEGIHYAKAHVREWMEP